MDNQKSDSDLLVHYECKKFIQENEKQFDLCAFYDDASAFYRGVCQYMIGHYPFNDPILSSAYILDVSKRQQKHSIMSSTLWYVSSGSLCIACMNYNQNSQLTRLKLTVKHELTNHDLTLAELPS